MKRYRLGLTSTHISPIGLGCWQFSMGKGLPGLYWTKLVPEEVRDIVKTSLDLGINWFDTAELYGGGTSERALAHSLRDIGVTSQDVFIATKWSPFFRRAAHITRSIHTRIAALDPFPIELYQIHAPISFSSIERQMESMLTLLRTNRVRAVGVSNFNVQQMRRADAVLRREGYVLASNQVRYSLLDRGPDTTGLIDACKELGVTLIAYSPLAQGLLTGRYHDDERAFKSLSGPRRLLPRFRRRYIAKTQPLIAALKRIAEAHDATAAQIALAWTIAIHGETIVAIPGATRAEQARSNAEAMNIELSKEEVDELDALSLEVAG